MGLAEAFNTVKALFYKGFISLDETFFKRGFYTLSIGCKIEVFPI